MFHARPTAPRGAAKGESRRAAARAPLALLCTLALAAPLAPRAVRAQTPAEPTPAEQTRAEPPAPPAEPRAQGEPVPGTELPAPAQLPAPSLEPAVGSDVDEVVVTGSRIFRDPNLGSIAPVEVLSGEQLGLSGETDIADVLNDIPALLGSTTAVGGELPFEGDGGSVLQLRGLGPERTLVLVNGRRHVGGVAGEQSVDIGSIPPALIERVEVLTGGASAIYGADAVTGVVNFILKEDHEGFDLRLRGGSSSRGDADSFDASMLYGLGFLGGRGNFTLASDLSRRENLRVDSRRLSRNNRVANDLPNPALRFQQGEIDAARTPNFARFFDPARGQFPRGSAIPSESAFQESYKAAFGSEAQLSDAERKLLRRAAGAPPRVLSRRPAIAISSFAGVIAPRDFDSRGLDTDGNGVDDCQESFVGFSARQEKLAGGCFVVGPDGRVRPFRDGVIADPIMQFGGDGSGFSQNQDFLTPEDDRYTFNLTSRLDVTEQLSLFGEAKYAFSKTDSLLGVQGFADQLIITPDNPFIPQPLQELARQAGGLLVSRDFTDLGRSLSTVQRQTARFVGGLEGTLGNGWSFELAGNYGTFRSTVQQRSRLIQDRLFAALDVTTDAQGRPVCRSELSPALPPGSNSRIPLFDPGFFTFRPGQGRCKPANIFGGRTSISREAAAFITQNVESSDELEQLVFSAVLSGDSADAFELPGGPVGFSLGLEYRDERSSARFDPLVLGVLPIDGPNGKKGQRVGDLPGFGQKSLVFDPETQMSNSGGSFDVKEAFAELSLPLLRGAPLAEELTLSTAARLSRYSTVGTALTWNFGASYAPVPDLRLRASVAQAVRAPNIDELFSPAQGALFMPQDPCEQSTIDALRAGGDPRGELRAANCRTAGIPEGFSSPLTARISGLSVGNQDLEEETGRTLSAGVVLQPRWLEGLSASADFFEIRIEDAIASVAAQDIIDGCFDSKSFPQNQNCALFTRNVDPNSPQFRGINFVRQTELNFAALETSGLDVSLRYEFDWLESAFRIGLAGTQVFKLDSFFDPSDTSAVNPELGELTRPEFAGNLDFGFSRGPLSLQWQTQYLDEQTLGEVETAQELFGRSAMVGEVFIHDFAFEYRLGDRYLLSGGVNNVTDVQPERTEVATPVSPVGRYLFVGMQVNF
jgi:iron complex outermembrane receptor protein